MTTIVTGIFGDIDVPKDPWRQDHDVRWVFVTDREDWTPPHYDQVIYEPPDGRHPRLQAKDPKLEPWRYAPDDDTWIWIDGSMQVISNTFVREAVAAAEGAKIAQWAHPDRVCIYPEAELSATLPKYADTPVLEQAEYYADCGHPKDWGLWATGLIVYNEPVPQLSQLWSTQMTMWGYQDQISEPFVLRIAGMRPRDLPYDLRSNPWICLHGHLTHL